MIKKVKAFSFIILLFMVFSFIPKVSASSATFSVKSNASTVAVGNNVTVTVTLSSGTPLGSWNFTVGYDTSRLKLVSSTAERDQTSAGVVASANQKSVSYKYTFKTLKAGTANVNISDAIVYDFSDEKMSLSKGSANITIKTWEQIEESYSTNANLKSISINGGELNPSVTLSPSFNKDTLEYTVELEPDTKEITVNANKEDNAASVSGTGSISVSEGSNKIEIVVTAQKGNTKKYIINAIVKELEPINVKVDGVNYTVVRKAENLTKPYLYTEDSTIIHEIEVPAFYSSITGYKLVGLKSEEGIIKLFIYDESKDSYKYYQELSLGKVVLVPLNIPDSEIPKGYIKSEVTINNEKVECIVNKEFSITLLYGKNVETGKTKLYTYDKEENTLQSYSLDTFDKINKKIELYTYIVLGLGGVIILLIVIFVSSISNSKKKLRERKEEMKQEIITNEISSKAEILSKKEKKKRDKELKKKQKELEELENSVKKKIEDSNNEQEKLANDDSKDDGLVSKEGLPLHQDSQQLQEFELETKNEQVDKKNKKKSKKKNEDDDMFML